MSEIKSGVFPLVDLPADEVQPAVKASPVSSDETIPGVEQHYSTATVAKMFDVKPAAIREWIRGEKIMARRINGLWRIPHSEVLRLGTQRYGQPEQGETIT